MKEVLVKKTWKEFRESKLLWFINQSLHLFGWAIILELDSNGDPINGYPARVRFRGFTEEANNQNYKVLTQYLKDNIDDIHDDITSDI